MTDRRTVVLTGAAGYVAGQLLDAFRSRYDLRLVDVSDTDRDGGRVEGIELLDPLADPAAFTQRCRGADVVVHCGYVRPQGPPSYAAERLNLDLTAQVYASAVEAGVPRVVCASTNQASKWYEQPWYAGRIDRVGPEDYPKPDTFYGWAKAAYESLGFLHACGGLGTRLEVAQIRVVAPRPIRAEAFADRPLAHYLRDIAGWVSPRDLAQLFVRAVEAPSLEDADGVPFQIFYGVSNNARTFWSITNARQLIGYAPVDDSEVEFADEIRAMVARG
ncbi:nucleoside-diphosphate-sugar epimerase [Friedmanniella endophytica]|uniref:Nucleoside-diphosphate-sugar epimerase n=1 Tax=Microlunatus kandeliicorticis TaxID=1759536 RepID=A0A7W3IVB5_9ACTN|nr:NAD(P)-dependent oxidoreductase [Microlunatus kandeliicorticis]MBA8795907.1 nucleoside-diphosphate-sugar epimerase [Microlunatus kandeliicorticis]